MGTFSIWFIGRLQDLRLCTSPKQIKSKSGLFSPGSLEWSGKQSQFGEDGESLDIEGGSLQRVTFKYG